MKNILTIVLPTFAVLTAMTLVVLLRTHSFDGLRSLIVERIPKRVEEVMEEVLE
jgi:hypothetical protein